MFKQILKKIKQYDRIIIHGHIRPDGDCYGSQFGLKRIIQDNFPKKEVYVVGQTCDYVSFLGNMDIIPDDFYKGALSICVDCGNKERLSDQRYQNGDMVIKIDHHIDDTPYGDISYVDEEAPSCTQIITDFAIKNKLKVSKEAAFALYVGLVTDTGRFRFDSVVGHTMEIAGFLLDKGVKVDEVDNLLSVETLKTLKLKGYTLLNFETTDAGFAYIKMTRDVIEKYGVTDDEAANMVGNLAGIEGFPVWGLFIEYPGNDIRIRIRSRGPEVQTLAARWNGGGHAKAAGASLPKWEDLDKFLEDVNSVVKNYKASNPDAK
jgi:phosphoesterase RecJ-like protein